jgi:hypothetical protein
MHSVFHLLLPTLVLLLAALSSGIAQDAPPREPPPEEHPIEDNSFLIEEAYNQEAGVIQHISNLVCASPITDGEFAYSFTEEWPVTGQDHQLGFTLVFLNSGSGGAGASDGVGDFLINYRYQITSGDVAVAPRLSLIVPTGDRARGNGDGVFGVQMNLPVSTRLSSSFVSHFNAGFTVLPGVGGTDASGLAVDRTLTAYTAGGSLVWLTSHRLNILLEALGVNEGSIGESGESVRETHFIVNPALRYAIDVGSLQIVPGFGVPVLLEDGREPEVSYFFYLSFEHPVGFL